MEGNICAAAKQRQLTVAMERVSSARMILPSEMVIGRIESGLNSDGSNQISLIFKKKLGRIRIELGPVILYVDFLKF
jgi:hypothetical protein